MTDRMNWFRQSFVSVLAFLALILCVPASAQTGQITGRVTDHNDAVLPNVSVDVVETSTAETRTVKTNSDGYYTVPSLSPGPYSISLESPGFKKFSRTGMQLEVGQDLRVDVQIG